MFHAAELVEFFFFKLPMTKCSPYATTNLTQPDIKVVVYSFVGFINVL